MALFVPMACVVLAFPVLGGAVESPGSRRATERIIKVGPSREIRSIAVAAKAAQDGDTIEIDSGDYYGDVAVWTQHNITVRAIAGQVRLFAAGYSAENKGIWVVRGGSMRVENVEFRGARVPDRNGAGIRLEKGYLVVRNCSFIDNENGILTSGDANSELDIANSEFANNGAGDGQSHNLYVGKIRRLTVTGSYFHHAKVGHLLKTRAAESHIFYNRLTDEIGGRASYELEFPNGGVAYVVGNIIQQSSQTENPNIISFGAEGYIWPKNELYLVNNTLADDRPKGGSYLFVKSGVRTVKAMNNLLVGNPGTLETAGDGEYRSNYAADWDQFFRASRQDYRLNPSSRLLGKSAIPLSANGVPLVADREYVHPRQTRLLSPGTRHPGALQTLGPAG